MPRVGIALGSNLGDRLANLRSARDLLQSISVSGDPFFQAPIYQTEPVNCPEGSPDFYNTVVEISYDGTPFQLLASTQSFQRKLGRPEFQERNAPRVIDIDLLYFGNERIRTSELELPHPRITERRFVLQPLAGISPDLVLPGNTKSITAHLGDLAPGEPPLAMVQAIW